MPATHAPAGYTKERPLVLAGKAFVGGEFIPGDVLAKATPQEKAALQGKPAQNVTPAALPSGSTPIAAIQQKKNAALKDWKENRTDAKAFQEWFAGSKIVDKAGKPVVVYHGTSADFSTFDKNKGKSVTDKLGSWLATDPNLSNERLEQVNSGGMFGEVKGRMSKGSAVMPVYASIKNPLKLKQRSDLEAYVSKRLVLPPDMLKKLRGYFPKDRTEWQSATRADLESYATDPASRNRVNADALDAADQGWDEKDVQQIAELARATLSEFDGIIIADDQGHGQAVVAFYPHQIKSKHNRGTFDPKNPHVSLSATLEEQIESVSEHQTAADKLAAAVITRAEAAGNVLSSEVRREAVALIRRLVKANRSPQQTLNEFVREFRAILLRYEPVLARTVTDAQLAAFLKGGRSVVVGLPELNPSTNLIRTVFDRQTMAEYQPPAPPDWTDVSLAPGEGEPIIHFDIIQEAAADLAARKILSPIEFSIARGDARMQGFSVSRIASLDAMEKVRDLLTEALVKGDTLKTWRAKVEEALDGSGLSPRRLENVFRTNLMFSYARGQKAIVQHPQVATAVAFCWRSEIRDSRLTYLCDALSRGGIDGTSLYSVDDPVWRRVAPISHYQCRCNTIFLSVERAAQKGLEVAKKWLRDGVRPPESELFVPMPDLSGVPEHERRQFEAWTSPWASDRMSLAA